jgi:hypothetical protein
VAKSHKAQHWIPRSYLRAWVDLDTPEGHEPYVHVFSRDGSEHRTRAPANLFKETDLYTITLPDGGRDLRLEHGLSDLETAFSAMRKDFIAKRRQLSVVRRQKLMAFVAALLTRTPAFRDHHLAHWQEVQRKMEDLDEAMKKTTPERRARAATVSIPPRDQKSTMTLDDVRRITASPMEHLLVPFIGGQLPFLLRMRCRVLCTTSEPGFITSDGPVVWFDPKWHTKPPLYRAPSLSDPLLEITVPLSPQQLMVLTHHDPAAPQYEIDYMDVADDVVTEMNRRTRFQCDKEFVVQRQTTMPRWFERGEIPADAWERVQDEEAASK